LGFQMIMSILRSKTSIGLIAIGCIILVWFIITELLEMVPPLFLPSPVDIVITFYELVKIGYREISLLHHTSISLMRVLTAFLLAVVTGIVLGLLMAMNRFIEAVFDPIIELYRPVPPIALIPLFIIWIGIGEMSKIGIIFISIFPVIVINTISGVRGISETKIWAAQSLGASKRKLFWHITLPGALPDILTGMRVGIAFGWTTLVASEMIAAASGIGWMALNARRFLRTDVIICGVIIMGVIGLLLDRLLRLIDSRFIPWKGRE
jgi:taurine transport system permease protein